MAKATTKKKRSSTTGRRKPKVDMAAWRKQLKAPHRIKFDDEQKEIFLDHLRRTGLKGESAAIAGVSKQTVNNHCDNDPEFQEAYDDATTAYRDRVVGHATTLALEGVQRTKYNKDGDILEVYQEYPIRLIELELKRVEPEFRDKQTVDLNHAGGVMVAPPGMTPEEWVEQQEAANTGKTPPE